MRVVDGSSNGARADPAGEYFEAHEELELAWRSAGPAERDFLQGLVHVAVAWYQAGRGNRVGCERQLEKATRRLSPYPPAHRGVDVEATLAQIEPARAIVATELARATAPGCLDVARCGRSRSPRAPGSARRCSHQ